jgi:hypothetical protein
MSIQEGFIVAAIIAAFCLFAVTLAWGDYQTRRIKGNG